MKVTNKTHWNSKDIVRLIRRVAEDELQPGQLKQARVYVSYGRRAMSGYGGWCFYGTMLKPNVRMKLLFPKEGPIDSVKVAKIIAHELGHSKGLKHCDMNNIRYGWVEGWHEYHAYATDYPISKVEPKTKAPADRVQKEFDKSQAMLEKWQSKLKRTTTIFKKWKRKTAYYEKKLAALKT